ncbi:hypothetical protein B0E54_06310 [Micromonospora sp. MH99]|nr:hypothetical protein [Micromonospora sp. MH99]
MAPLAMAPEAARPPPPPPPMAIWLVAGASNLSRAGIATMPMHISTMPVSTVVRSLPSPIIQNAAA